MEFGLSKSTFEVQSPVRLSGIITSPHLSEAPSTNHQKTQGHHVSPKPAKVACRGMDGSLGSDEAELVLKDGRLGLASVRLTVECNVQHLWPPKLRASARHTSDHSEWGQVTTLPNRFALNDYLLLSATVMWRWHSLSHLEALAFIMLTTSSTHIHFSTFIFHLITQFALETTTTGISHGLGDSTY